MMNLQEAIDHAKQVAAALDCSNCREDHLELAAWLEELQVRRSSDRLKQLWSQQEKFMELLQEKRNFPKHPVDLTTKQGQKAVKDIAFECMHELFEAVHLLKNSKSHRATQVQGFAREEFKEELSDVLHYFVEICVLSGITLEELFESYMKKGQVNEQRILSGY